jgi:hypothetical protein
MFSVYASKLSINNIFIKWPNKLKSQLNIFAEKTFHYIIQTHRVEGGGLGHEAVWNLAIFRSK